MIDFIDIQKLGFKKESENDSVYENQYGRPYWYMEFLATVSSLGVKNEITFNWDCDTRIVSVFKNEKQKIASFDKWEEFIEFFSLFLEDEDVSDDRKRELIETLWSIVVAFVDLGWQLRSFRPDDIKSFQLPTAGFDTTADGQSIVLVDQTKLGELQQALRADDLETFYKSL